VPWPGRGQIAVLECCPAVKLSGKETSALMQVVPEWWSDELGRPKSWAVIELTGGQKLLLHFKHKSAGDYHAICAMPRHQGSECIWPCVWCHVQDSTGSGRACTKCKCYCCHHLPYSGIDSSIVEPLDILVDLAPEPEWFAASLDASHVMLKPRRKRVGSMTDKE
jgi:hypothetical protein